MLRVLNKGAFKTSLTSYCTKVQKFYLLKTKGHIAKPHNPLFRSWLLSPNRESKAQIINSEVQSHYAKTDEKLIRRRTQQLHHIFQSFTLYCIWINFLGQAPDMMEASFQLHAINRHFVLQFMMLSEMAFEEKGLEIWRSHNILQ